MNATRLYPGMCDGSLEIFFHKEEKTLKVIEDGTVKPFAELPAERKIFLHVIMEQEPRTKKILQAMFPDCEEKQIEKLAKCRFGGLDFTPDYCPKSGTFNQDIVPCPLRAECAGCGIICRDVEYNGSALNQIDIKAIQLMASDYKTHVLAEELGMPEGSFHVYRTNLYRRVGVKSKPELARVGVELGLI